MTLDKYWRQSQKLSTEKSSSNHYVVFSWWGWGNSGPEWERDLATHSHSVAELGIEASWIYLSTGQVFLGVSGPLSVPQFAHLENGTDKSTYKITLSKLRFWYIKYGFFFLDNFY